MSGDNLVVTTGHGEGQCYWHLAGRDQGCCQTPYSVQDCSSQQRIIPPSMSLMPRLRNPNMNSMTFAALLVFLPHSTALSLHDLETSLPALSSLKKQDSFWLVTTDLILKPELWQMKPHPDPPFWKFFEQIYLGKYSLVLSLFWNAFTRLHEFEPGTLTNPTPILTTLGKSGPSFSKQYQPKARMGNQLLHPMWPWQVS